jgi:hypothetical protein
MGNVIGARVPGWFRLLSWLGLLWNGLGVYMYLRSVGMFGDPLAGLDPAHAALGRSVPGWVTGVFAVAVFAGLLGSLCMVAGKKLAASLLMLSLLAVIVQSGWIVFVSHARAVEGMVAVAMPACLILIAFLLRWFAG